MSALTLVECRKRREEFIAREETEVRANNGGVLIAHVSTSIRSIADHRYICDLERAMQYYENKIARVKAKCKNAIMSADARRI